MLREWNQTHGRVKGAKAECVLSKEAFIMKLAIALSIVLHLAACALGAKVTLYSDTTCGTSMGPTVFGFPNPNNITAQCAKSSNYDGAFTPPVEDTWSKEVSCTYSTFVIQNYKEAGCSGSFVALPGQTGVCYNSVLLLRGNVKSLKVECPGTLPTVTTSAACAARGAGAVAAVLLASFLLA